MAIQRGKSQRVALVKGDERKRAHGTAYVIGDPVAFAEPINDAIARRHGGSRSEAARAKGIPYSTLKRFCDGRGVSVRHETMEKLRSMVGSARAVRLEGALTVGPAAHRLHRYDEWLAAERMGLAYRAVRERELAASGIAENRFEDELLGMRLTERLHELHKLQRRLERRFPSYWTEFKNWLKVSGHFKGRAELAILRVVAPLMDFWDSGCVERHVSEFSDNELRRFIDTGIRREKILLSRAPDVRRVNDIQREFARDPYQFIP